MYAREMNPYSDYSHVPFDEMNLQKWKEHQERIISLVYPAIELRANKVKQTYIDKLNKVKKAEFINDLPAGTKVMLKDPAYIKDPGSRPSTEPPYIGPYYIGESHKVLM